MTKQKEIIATSSSHEEDSIDIIALLQTLWVSRKQIVKTVLLFLCIGLFVAVFSENEYTASTTIVPQSSKKSGGSLSGLAALAGVNLGSIGQEASISPQLYPQIINSVSFQKEMLETLLTIEGQDQKVTYREFYTNIYSPSLLSSIKKYTIGLPGVLLGLLRSKRDISADDLSQNKDAVIRISDEDKELMDLLKSQLAINVNDKEGYISLSARMPEAKASAELVKRVQDLLEGYVIDFKIQKSVAQLSFIKERFVEKEKEFKTTQEKLAIYSDENQGVNSARAKSGLLLLESQYDLAYSVYSELAKQLETQQIKVKEDTPVFTVIEPVFVPLEKSKPKRAMILFTWIFFGLLLSSGVILGKSTVKNILSQIRFKDLR